MYLSKETLVGNVNLVKVCLKVKENTKVLYNHGKIQ